MMQWRRAWDTSSSTLRTLSSCCILETPETDTSCDPASPACMLAAYFRRNA